MAMIDPRTPGARWLEVFIDGVKRDHVLEVDPDTGVAHVAVRGEKGGYRGEWRDGKMQPVVEVVTGQIELRETRPGALAQATAYASARGWRLPSP